MEGRRRFSTDQSAFENPVATPSHQPRGLGIHVTSRQVQLLYDDSRRPLSARVGDKDYSRYASELPIEVEITNEGRWRRLCLRKILVACSVVRGAHVESRCCEGPHEAVAQPALHRSPQSSSESLVLSRHPSSLVAFVRHGLGWLQLALRGRELSATQAFPHRVTQKSPFGGAFDSAFPADPPCSKSS